ncbi:unnamed protein product, partial [Ectocarpus sp. 13 AM-2016]
TDTNSCLPPSLPDPEAKKHDASSLELFHRAPPCQRGWRRSNLQPQETHLSRISRFPEKNNEKPCRIVDRRPFRLFTFPDQEMGATSVVVLFLFGVRQSILSSSQSRDGRDIGRRLLVPFRCGALLPPCGGLLGSGRLLCLRLRFRFSRRPLLRLWLLSLRLGLGLGLLSLSLGSLWLLHVCQQPFRSGLAPPAPEPHVEAVPRVALAEGLYLRRGRGLQLLLALDAHRQVRQGDELALGGCVRLPDLARARLFPHDEHVGLARDRGSHPRAEGLAHAPEPVLALVKTGPSPDLREDPRHDDRLTLEEVRPRAVDAWPRDNVEAAAGRGRGHHRLLGLEETKR